MGHKDTHTQTECMCVIIFYTFAQLFGHEQKQLILYEVGQLELHITNMIPTPTNLAHSFCQSDQSIIRLLFPADILLL